MRDPAWSSQVDPFRGTTPIPQAGGLEYLPEQAVGHVWAVGLAPSLAADKTCSNTDASKLPEDQIRVLPLGRFVEAGDKCRTKSIAEQKVYEFRVTARAAATTSVSAFLDLSGEGERAFEVAISHPVHVTFEDPQSCIARTKLRQLDFTAADRVCSLYWVHTVKQTRIHSRAFSKLSAEGEVGFSIIKVGGSLFTSSEEMKQATVITGNHSVITQYMHRDPTTAYVVKAPPAPVAAIMTPLPDAVNDPLADAVLRVKKDKKMSIEVDNVRETLRR